MTTLAEFTQDLVNDEQAWARLRKEPQRTLDDSGLSQEDKDLLTNGPVETVRKKLEEQGVNPTASLVIIW